MQDDVPKKWRLSRMVGGEREWEGGEIERKLGDTSKQARQCGFAIKG